VACNPLEINNCEKKLKFTLGLHNKMIKSLNSNTT
jgi:hypothetical protein